MKQQALFKHELHAGTAQGPGILPLRLRVRQWGAARAAGAALRGAQEPWGMECTHLI